MKAIKVIWKNGEEEFLKEGLQIAAFTDERETQRIRDFMLEGISDQLQSVNVVPFPKSELAN